MPDVAPVAGMTPAQVAKELRILIREQLYMGIMGKSPEKKKQDPAKYGSYLDGNIKGMRTDLSLISSELSILYDICKFRRPSEIRAKINEIRPRLAAMGTRLDSQQHYKASLLSIATGVGGDNLSHLRPAVERAYQLVQALPTIEQATVGKEATTLRAMTSILKVYYGVDVDAGPEDLVQALMEQLQQEAEKPPEIWKPFVIHGESGNQPLTVEIDWKSIAPFATLREVTLGMLPWRFYSAGGNDVTQTVTAEKDKTDGGHGWGDSGSLEKWNGGMCSFSHAMEAFAWVRSRWSDMVMKLGDRPGLWWVTADKNAEPNYIYIPSSEPVLTPPIQHAGLQHTGVVFDEFVSTTASQVGAMAMSAPIPDDQDDEEF